MDKSNSSPPMNSAIVFCVEKGGLEYKALCMALSLRANWDDWSDIPMYAYSPRAHRQISPWLSEIFDNLHIHRVVEPLNSEFDDYPLANKPLCMAHAEQNLDHENIIFLDSDIFCWNQPKHLTLSEGKSLAMMPDTTKSIASSGSHDPYEPMWMALYKEAGVSTAPYVQTVLTNERVRSWWSSGVIVSKRRSGLMTQWLELFQRVVNKPLFVPEARYLREQMTICALAAAHYSEFEPLPLYCNFPVQNYRVLKPKGFIPEDATLWHYQPYLNKTFRIFETKLDSIEDVPGKTEFAEAFTRKLWKRYPSMLGLDESFISKWRHELKLGPRIRKLLGKQKSSDPSV